MRAVKGSAIGDELLDWPPDLLALTEVVLERTTAGTGTGFGLAAWTAS